MSVEQNKAIMRRMTEEVFVKGNLSIIPDLVAPNYVMHGQTDVKGPEGLKKMAETFRKAFPDYQETINYMVAEGDLVASFNTRQGTFMNDIGGMVATGKKSTGSVATLTRYENGKQVEVWTYSDSLSWYRQLGIPIPQGK